MCVGGGGVERVKVGGRECMMGYDIRRWER